uniref:Gamma-glutamyltransferase 6 n=1 Tax=Astyanax mexicanus TaxID=7994 RepID=W5L3P1_ASTMX
MVALILLGIVFGFMLCEWYGWWPDPLGLQTHLSNDAGVLEEHHHDHHNHHEGEEDDDHEDGDHHHDPGGHSHDHTSLYHHGVVLTSSAYCSRAGKELLREGGNVVDAAIASLLCLGVVHPHTSGVGQWRSCNSIRSTAPQLPSASYGVPSVLQGLKDLHSQWGRSEWSRLFKDAITLAEDGFHIDGVLGSALATHKEKILQSEACDIFCDGSGRVKSAGVLAANQNLSELLRAASLNESHFPETLAMKLAEDLSARERPTFLAALREQSLSFQSAAGDLNRAATTFASLLNLTQGLANRAPAEKNQDLAELLALDTQSSHIGVLDGKGNFIVMSASLNNTWGSGRFLPSSGVMLSSFTSNISDVPYFSFPLLVKINNDDDDDSNDTESNDTQGESEEDKEVQIIATTGGLSALLNAATDGQLQQVDECSDGTLSMVLRFHAEHASAYGAPVSSAHADGY